MPGSGRKSASSSGPARQVDAADRARLGEPVAGPDLLRLEALEGHRDPGGIERRGHDAGEAREVVVADPARLRHGQQHGVHARQVGDALALQQRERRGRIEVILQHEARPRGERGEREVAGAERGEERHRDQHALARTQVHRAAGLDGVAREVAVGELHALGERGRPRGVDHVAHVVGRERGPLRPGQRRARRASRRSRRDRPPTRARGGPRGSPRPSPGSRGPGSGPPRAGRGTRPGGGSRRARPPCSAC